MSNKLKEAAIQFAGFTTEIRESGPYLDHPVTDSAIDKFIEKRSPHNQMILAEIQRDREGVFKLARELCSSDKLSEQKAGALLWQEFLSK